jgi:hypothetical protein
LPDSAGAAFPGSGFLDQPTLVMMGTDDPIVPVANGRILNKLIPDSRLAMIDDGHLFLVTSAAQSADIIAGFLDEESRSERQGCLRGREGALRRSLGADEDGAGHALGRN